MSEVNGFFFLVFFVHSVVRIKTAKDEHRLSMFLTQHRLHKLSNWWHYSSFLPIILPALAAGLFSCACELVRSINTRVSWLISSSHSRRKRRRSSSLRVNCVYKVSFILFLFFIPLSELHFSPGPDCLGSDSGDWWGSGSFHSFLSFSHVSLRVDIYATVISCANPAPVPNSAGCEMCRGHE